MTTSNHFHLWTALVTPFNKNKKIDYQSFENLIRKQQEVQNAILVIGSTGEGLALTSQEKKEIIKFVNNLNLDIPVMVGVGGFDLEQQLAWINYCNDYPIDSFLLVTPLYAKPGIQGQTKWFKALLNASKKPCMLYNIPSRTGVSLYPQVIKNLEGHSNLWSLKEASGNLDMFKQYRQIAPRLAIFSGEDALMPDLAREGAQGLVSATANVWPAGIKHYLEKCLQNKIDDTIPLWQKAIKKLFQLASNPVPAKVLLHHKGWIKEPILRPPLSHEDLVDINELIKTDNEVENLS